MTHEQIRELLPLAAAGALETADAAEVARHAGECPACASELEEWAAVAGAGAAMPRVTAPDGLAAATVRRATEAMEAEAERRWERTVAVALGLFSWLAGIAFWLLGRVLSGGGLFWWAAGSTVAVWLTAGVAAIAVGRRRVSWRTI